MVGAELPLIPQSGGGERFACGGGAGSGGAGDGRQLLSGGDPAALGKEGGSVRLYQTLTGLLDSGEGGKESGFSAARLSDHGEGLPREQVHGERRPLAQDAEVFEPE